MIFFKKIRPNAKPYPTPNLLVPQLPQNRLDKALCLGVEPLDGAGVRAPGAAALRASAGGVAPGPAVPTAAPGVGN